VVLERGQINQGASGQNAGSLHFQLEQRLIQNIEMDVRELEFHVGLAKLAITHWRSIGAELKTDVGLSMHGGLMVSESPVETELLERKLQIERSQGLMVEMLDGREARKLAPFLSDNIHAALHCPDEGHSNPRLLTPAFVARATELGVHFITGARVSAVQRANQQWQVTFEADTNTGNRKQIHCENVLNTAGAWAVNLHIPLYPVGLTMNVTEKTAPLMPFLIQHVARKLSLKQTEDGNLLIGGGWGARLQQRSGSWSSNASPHFKLESVRGNLRAAVDVVPAVESLRLLRTWTGTTAITPDLLPVLGEVPQAPGFFVASGGSGFTYGPTYAALMTELILTGTSSYPLDPFSPARFSSLNSFMGQN